MPMTADFAAANHNIDNEHKFLSFGEHQQFFNIVDHNTKKSKKDSKKPKIPGKPAIAVPNPSSSVA